MSRLPSAYGLFCIGAVALIWYIVPSGAAYWTFTVDTLPYACGIIGLCPAKGL